MDGDRVNSVWEADTNLSKFPQLEKDLNTDVLVIGGGMAGLLCAWNLHREGIDCTLIEANRIMQGVSGRTTAKITSQHGLIYHKLLRNMGPDQARMYWKANEDALGVFRTLAGEIDCDFEDQCSYLYQINGAQKLEAEMEACKQLGIPAQWGNVSQLPFPVEKILCFPKQAQFHPLKFAAHISRGLNIYEKTKALEIQGKRVRTPKAVITAKKIIVATHFPFLNSHGAYFLKLYQQRSYVIALDNAEKLSGMYRDCEENGLSLRSVGHQLLLGGGGHRTGKQGHGWTPLEETARKYYPQARIAAKWATQDCMTLDGLPYIGMYSKATPDLYVVTGFQKWGMTTSMVAAGILTDLIRERENAYAYLFDPSRSMLHKQLLTNGMDSALNLIRPTAPRCPHLGCALRWNPAEHSWDCPCHGSRFDESGKLLNNPATGDLKRPPKH